MKGHPIRPSDTIICVSESWASQLCFFCVQTMQLWAQGATYEQKGGSKTKTKKGRAPNKMFQTPKNRQARKHPILFTWLIRHPKNRERAINSEKEF